MDTKKIMRKGITYLGAFLSPFIIASCNNGDNSSGRGPDQPEVKQISSESELERICSSTFSTTTVNGEQVWQDKDSPNKIKISFSDDVDEVKTTSASESFGPTQDEFIIEGSREPQSVFNPDEIIHYRTQIPKGIIEPKLENALKKIDNLPPLSILKDLEISTDDRNSPIIVKTSFFNPQPDSITAKIKDKENNNVAKEAIFEPAEQDWQYSTNFEIANGEYELSLFIDPPGKNDKLEKIHTVDFSVTEPENQAPEFEENLTSKLFGSNNETYSQLYKDMTKSILLQLVDDNGNAISNNVATDADNDKLTYELKVNGNSQDLGENPFGFVDKNNLKVGENNNIQLLVRDGRGGIDSISQTIAVQEGDGNNFDELPIEISDSNLDGIYNLNLNGFSGDVKVIADVNGQEYNVDINDNKINLQDFEGENVSLKVIGENKYSTEEVDKNLSNAVVINTAPTYTLEITREGNPVNSSSTILESDGGNINVRANNLTDKEGHSVSLDGLLFTDGNSKSVSVNDNSFSYSVSELAGKEVEAGFLADDGYYNGENRKLRSFYVDAIPTISEQNSAGNTLRKTENTDVTITSPVVTDDKSINVEYSLDGGNTWQIANSSFIVNDSEDVTIQWRAEDSSGQSVNIDNTTIDYSPNVTPNEAPYITNDGSFDGTQNMWTEGESSDLTAPTFEDDEGVTETFVKYNDGSWQSFSGNYDFGGLNWGENTVYMKASDDQGLESAIASANVYKDSLLEVTAQNDFDGGTSEYPYDEAQTYSLTLPTAFDKDNNGSGNGIDKFEVWYENDLRNDENGDVVSDTPVLYETLSGNATEWNFSPNDLTSQYGNVDTARIHIKGVDDEGNTKELGTEYFGYW